MQQDPSIPAGANDATGQPLAVTSNKPSNGWRSALSTLAIIIAAPAVALLLTAFVFQSYEVDGPSMETTLQNRDRLIVWKVPRTVARVTGHDYTPRRDDVIIFVKHGLLEPNSTEEKQLIKRVIGLPGEHVVVHDGHITIYNKDNPQGFNPDINHDFSANIASISPGDVDLVVPPGQVFVCGDNRTNSLDSRSFGPIPTHDIVGKLTIRIFPVSNFKSFI
ncbi:MAG TPA: signal peptidase I [Patescibacteria group bacterium]|nr:signal peptidase I [Patescibacteria group bacterium]